MHLYQGFINVSAEGQRVSTGRPKLLNWASLEAKLSPTVGGQSNRQAKYHLHSGQFAWFMALNEAPADIVLIWHH